MSWRVVRPGSGVGSESFGEGNRRRDRRFVLLTPSTVRIFAFLCVAAALPWLAACASGHPTKAPAAKTIEEVPPPAMADAGPGAKRAAPDLAEQARRDMEAWRKLRGNQSQPEGNAASHAATPASGPGPAALAGTGPPPAIVWNDGHGETVSAAPPPRVVKAALPSPAPASPPRVTSPPPAEMQVPPESRPVAPPIAPKVVTPPPAASQPAPAQNDTERFQNLLVELRRELYQQAADSDMPMRQMLLVAATTLVNPDRAIDANLIPSLTARERQLLESLQLFFADLGRELVKSGDPEAIPAAVERLRKLIRTDPQLRLANASLCSNVEGFGKFRSFEPRRFLAHSEQQVIVYVEVDKFTSETNAKGEFVTELSQQLVIYSDRDGIPVWQEDWQVATDVTRNKRTDFFMRQIVTIPKALSVGQYQMKIRVRDNKSRAEAEASIPFEMVADPKMAAGAAR